MQDYKKYTHFNKYVLRAPAYPFNFFKEFSSEKDISDEQFKKMLSDNVVIEAIFLASPVLHTEIAKWLKNEITDKKSIEKLKFSILKYISRMSSRSTPFGLFAGCVTGDIDDEIDIKLKGALSNLRHTRFDMNFLVALAQNIIRLSTIQDQLLFYPNTSLYEMGDKYRFVEYYYYGGRRKHQIVEVDKTEYISGILTVSKNGISKNDLINSLVGGEVSKNMAQDFIAEIISGQILISELEPSVSGTEFFTQILETLEKLNGTETLVERLKQLESKIIILDNRLGNDTDLYNEIVTLLKDLETEYDIKYLFQTDMILSSVKNTLSKTVADDVKKGLGILNKLASPPEKTYMSEFRSAFRERYEDREVPLSKVLDTEIGIGYKQGNNNYGDLNPLIDDISLPFQNSSTIDVKWTNNDALFHKKLSEAYADNAYIITITDSDVEPFKENWNDLPDTISIITEVLKSDDGVNKVYITPYGGSSAANMLGRFCHGDQDLYTYTKEIIGVEEQINANKLCSEIVHLPQARVGNILMRPHFRKYEILYLGKSLLDNEYQLGLDDLMLSIKRNRLVLRSKKHNREVVPYLTNAHNYYTDSLPIYHFLSDYPIQDVRTNLHFSYGQLADQYVFLPRVEYKNIILYKATWNISSADIKHLLDIKDIDKLLSEIEIFREKKMLPQYVALSDGDNELLINFSNVTSVQMLFDQVSKRGQFKLTEFLFDKDSHVKDSENNYYANQIILSYYNKEKLEKINNQI